MVTRLDPASSCLRFLAYASYSSPVTSTRLLSRTFLRPVFYPTFRLPYIYRLDDILVSYLYGLYASLYLYSPDLYIYWVGDGMIPIFNLLCNHPSVVT